MEERLVQIKNKCEKCKKCSLCNSRTNLVFSDGKANNKLMLIGEAPGYWEDMKGLPFVGKAGQLLDKIFASSEYHRVFIFCSAEIKELSQIEQIEEKEFSSTGFTTPQQGKDSKFWYPSGINFSILQVVGANAMLKSIEDGTGANIQN